MKKQVKFQSFQVMDRAVYLLDTDGNLWAYSDEDRWHMYESPTIEVPDEANQVKQAQVRPS